MRGLYAVTRLRAVRSEDMVVLATVPLSASTITTKSGLAPRLARCLMHD
jgi:hypothetical protein